MADFYKAWCDRCLRRDECDRLPVMKDCFGRLTCDCEPEYCLNYLYDDTCYYLSTFGRMAAHEPWYFADKEKTRVMVWRTREDAQFIYDHLNTNVWPGLLTNNVWVQKSSEMALGGPFKVKYYVVPRGAAVDETEDETEEE